MATLSNRPSSTRSFVPEVVSSAAPPRSRVESQPPFLFKAHPERWTVMAGKVIPLLARIPLVAGLNGTNQVVRRGQPDLVTMGTAREAAMDRGWTIIPVESVPPHHLDLGEEASYLCQPEGRPDVTLSIYTRVYPGSDAVEVDELAYVEFCEYQISQGVIQPPAQYVLVALAEKIRGRLSAAVDKATRTPSYAEIVVRLQEDLKAVESALSEATKTAVPSRSRKVRPSMDSEGPPSPPPRARKVKPEGLEASS